MSASSFGPGAADDDHRDAGALRVRDRGDDVGHAGPGGDGAHAGPPGDARVAVGGVTGGLLVADVDDADAFVETAVVDGLDVPAAEREEVRRAVACKRLRDQSTAVNERHTLKCTTRLDVVPAQQERGGPTRRGDGTVWTLGRRSFDRLVNVPDEPGERRNEHLFGDAPPDVPLRVPPSQGSMRNPWSPNTNIRVRGARLRACAAMRSSDFVGDGVQALGKWWSRFAQARLD